VIFFQGTTTNIPYIHSVVHSTLNQLTNSTHLRLTIQLNRMISRNGGIIDRLDELRRRRSWKNRGGERELERVGAGVKVVGRRKMRRKRWIGGQVSASSVGSSVNDQNIEI
jgi:hypothetical protein